jgi:hypothetical protein
MTEIIKPIICLEEGIVALLLEVDRRMLPEVVDACYGLKSEVGSPERHVCSTLNSRLHPIIPARPVRATSRPSDVLQWIANSVASMIIDAKTVGSLSYFPVTNTVGEVMSAHEHWQMDASAPELYERYLVPAITSIWANDLLDRVGPRRGESILLRYRRRGEAR